MMGDNMKELNFEQYVEIFMEKIPRAEKVDRISYRGRCVVCGDSKKSKFKKRFYLVKSSGSYPDVVKCHNCGYKSGAFHFFKKYMPDDVEKRSASWTERDLSVIKKLSEGVPVYKRNDIIESISKDDYITRYNKELVIAKKVLCNFFVKHTYSILDNPQALSYMRSRNIPEKYVTEMRILRNEFHDFKKFRYAYFRDYAMIPFIDPQDNKPYYFHSRRFKNLNSSMSSYLACPYRTDDVEVSFFMNDLRVTTDLPVIIAEGTIDAMNLPNSIAVNGIHKLTEEQIRKFEHRYGENIIYALDNETIDHDATKKVKELLRLGKQVFLWGELIKDLPVARTIKDFNKLCCVANRFQFPMESIVKYTKNNVAALL